MTLVAAELSLRAIRPLLGRDADTRAQSETPLAKQILRLFTRHPYTERARHRGYRLKAGWDDGRIRINRLGMRGPELANPKPADTFRILCLGDSVTFGLAECPPFPPRLEHELNARAHPNVRFEVANGGVEGYTIYHAAAALETDWRGIEPDLVFVMIGWNNTYKLGSGFEAEFIANAAELPWLLRRTLLGQYVARAWYGVVLPRRARRELAAEAGERLASAPVNEWTVPLGGDGATSDFYPQMVTDTRGRPFRRVFRTGPFLSGQFLWMRVEHPTRRGAGSVRLVDARTCEEAMRLDTRVSRTPTGVVVERLYAPIFGEACVFAETPGGETGAPYGRGARVTCYPTRGARIPRRATDEYAHEAGRLIAHAQALGAHVVLSTLPSRIGPYISAEGKRQLRYPGTIPNDYETFADLYHTLNERIQSIAEEHGVACVDMASAMQGPNVEALIFDHCHFTCEGSGVFAKQLAEALARLPLVPAEPTPERITTAAAR